MKIEEKNQLVDNLSEELSNASIIYVADISELDAEKTSSLRRLCFNKNIKLRVVKNTLLKRAMEKSEKEYEGIYDLLKGPTSIMLAEKGNEPAKLIKEFRKTSDRPILKGAIVEEMVYVGDEQLEFLTQIKSKEELVADIVLLLQSPLKTVIGSLQSGGHKLSGIIKTLSEKSE